MTEVRAAVPADAYEVARVQVRSWRSAYRRLIAQDFLDGLEPKFFADRSGLCRDGDFPNFGELMAIYVDPAHMRRGVGRSLLAAARERLRLVGVAGALLWVLDGNVPARWFYERDRWGFDGACRTTTFGDSPVRQVRYRCAPV